MMYPKIEWYSCSQYIQIQNKQRRTKNFSNSSAFAERTIIKKGRRGKTRRTMTGKSLIHSPYFSGRSVRSTKTTQYIYVRTYYPKANLDFVFLQMYPLRPLIDPWSWAQIRGQSTYLGHPLEKCTIIQLQLTRFSSSEYFVHV